MGLKENKNILIKIENTGNSITSPTTNGRQEKESDETAPGANNIEKSDLQDNGSDLTSNIDSSNDEGTNGAE